MQKKIWHATRHLLERLTPLDINEQLRLENEYLLAENQVLKNQFQKSGKRLLFTDEQRRELAIKAKALGKRMFEIVTIVRPETVIFWYRKLVAMKFDSSQSQRKPGRPPVDVDIEKIILGIAKDNSSWGYLRIAGALANLGHKISKSSVRNILKTQWI